MYCIYFIHSGVLKVEMLGDTTHYQLSSDVLIYKIGDYANFTLGDYANFTLKNDNIEDEKINIGIILCPIVGFMIIILGLMIVKRRITNQCFVV
jgi:hypothetical protein